MQVPWLVLLFSIITTGVLRCDQGHAQQFYDREVTENLGLIDLNTATQAELETLPGIDPVLAMRMISMRPFIDLQDLKRVPRIDPILMERVEPKVMLKAARQ